MGVKEEKLLHFQDLHYYRPDIRSFSEQAKRAKNLFQKWNKAKNLRDASLNFQQIVDEYQQLADLARIYAALNVNDMDYAREVSFWEQIQPTIHRLIHSVHGWLRQKSSLAELKEFLGANFIAGAQIAHLIHNRQAQDEWFQEQELVSRLLAGKSEGRNQTRLWLEYLDLIQLRRIIAFKQGFGDYTDFCFAKLNILGYTKEEMAQLRQTLQLRFSPIVQAILTEKRSVSNEKNVLTEESPELSETTLFVSAREILAQQVSLGTTTVESVSRLNVLCNHLQQPEDWFWRLAQAGYVDLQPDARKAEGVECFYLPQVKTPFLFANMQRNPEFLMDLLRELGCANAYLLAAQEHIFTPFIELGLASREFVAQTFAYLALPQMSIFYGSYAEDYQQWLLRMAILRLYFTSFLDEFQARVYAPDARLLTSTDLMQQWADLWQEYFSFISEEDFAHVAGFSPLLFDQLLLLNQPGATSEILMAQLASLQFWDRYRDQSGKGKVIWESFCRCGSKELFLARLQQTSFSFALDEAMLKRLAYQVAYFVGY